MAREGFDLESYISNYTGHGKITRLLFIAKNVPQLELEAAKLAIEELQKTSNTALYREVTEKYGPILGGKYAFDENWVSSVDQSAQKKQEKLEIELNSYKSNLIKESIRMGHNDLGDFFYERGDLQNALKSYVRTRDFSTTSKHIMTMCLNVVKVSLEMNNHALVNQYVSKAEGTPDVVKDTVALAKLKVANGLSLLDAKRYKAAAKKFIETPIEIGTSFSDILSQQDIAIYGGLTALATYDRRELKQKCLDDPGFRNFLELVPEVREMIGDFHASKYTSCLAYLEKLRPDFELDVYLREHIASLYEKIRSRALTQYVSPFTSVNLNRMAETFSTDVASLEKELAKLITDNQISARIDSHNKILYARHTDQRGVTYSRAMDLGDNYVRETEAHIRRMSVLKHDFAVKSQRKGTKMMM